MRRKGTQAAQTGAKAGRGRPGAAVQEVDPQVPAEEAKRIRRMLSNRESARRSRHRKQAHLQDLENQVSQLSMEKEQLEEHLDEMEGRVRSANDENGCLMHRVRSLRGKLLKMAAAIRGEGPMPSLDDLEQEDDTFNSSGATQAGLNGSFRDHHAPESSPDVTAMLRARRYKCKSNRSCSLERSSKRNCW